MTIQYLYPDADKEVGRYHDWSGTFADIDEGTVSPNDSDLIAFTSLLENDYFTETLSFYLGNFTIIPSSITTNIRGFYSNSDTPSNGVIGVASVFLKDSASNILGQYNSNDVFVNYIWSETGLLGTLNIALSGVNYYNNSNDSYIEVHLSGNRLFVDDFLCQVTALDIKISGDIEIPPSDTITLYMSGQVPTGINENITLYTVGHMVSDSGLDLYTYGHAPTDSGIPLFIEGFDSTSSGISLYIAGHLPVDSGLSLYTYGKVTDSGILGLFVKGYGDTGVNNIPLYLQGLLSGVDYGWSNNNANLFLGATPSTSGELNLYIEGQGTGLLTNTITLHTFNSEDDSNLNSIPLYIVGGLESGNIPLYLCNNTQTFSSANSGTLYVGGFDGTTISGLLYNTTNLYIGGNPTNNSVNLVIINSGIDSLTNNLNLVMAGTDVVYDSANSGISLALWNQYANVNSGIPLFLYSRQAYDSSGGLNLYMSRDNDSLAGNISLFMNGPTGLDSGISMYMSGNTSSFNSVTLVIPSSIGQSFDSVKLFSHGF